MIKYRIYTELVFGVSVNFPSRPLRTELYDSHVCGEAVHVKEHACSLVYCPRLQARRHPPCAGEEIKENFCES